MHAINRTLSLNIEQIAQILTTTTKLNTEPSLKIGTDDIEVPLPSVVTQSDYSHRTETYLTENKRKTEAEPNTNPKMGKGGYAINESREKQ